MYNVRADQPETMLFMVNIQMCNISRDQSEMILVIY